MNERTIPPSTERNRLASDDMMMIWACHSTSGMIRTSARITNESQYFQHPDNGARLEVITSVPLVQL
jgi:hypothetical protein